MIYDDAGSPQVDKAKAAYDFMARLGYTWNGKEWVRNASFWGMKGDIV